MSPNQEALAGHLPRRKAGIRVKPRSPPGVESLFGLVHFRFIGPVAKPPILRFGLSLENSQTSGGRRLCWGRRNSKGAGLGQASLIGPRLFETQRTQSSQRRNQRGKASLIEQKSLSTEYTKCTDLEKGCRSGSGTLVRPISVLPPPVYLWPSFAFFVTSVSSPSC